MYEKSIKGDTRNRIKYCTRSWSIYGLFIYMIEYHVETVAKESYYEYEVVMQSVGAPLFFSSADGRLLLKRMIR